MTLFYPYAFESQLQEFGVGKTKKIWYKVLFLPHEIAQKLPFDKYPRLRIEGEIADVPICNAFIPAGDGRYYVIVAPQTLKSAEVKLGDVIEMRFKITDQDYVEVPNILQSAIDESQSFASLWHALTPGKKRMLAHHVLSAKTDKTQKRRVAEAIDSIKYFKADLKLWRKSRKD